MREFLDKIRIEDAIKIYLRGQQLQLGDGHIRVIAPADVRVSYISEELIDLERREQRWILG